MKFTVDSKYIVLPASHEAQKKRLYFYIDEKLAFDLVVALDNENPDYYFPVNLERFKGKSIRLECDYDMELKFESTDEPVLDYAGKYRPIVHFTARRGWINDPNGLTYLNGKYLMYFQHNPAATVWENMHWGSAESTDLVHWKEKDDVLFPDDNGTIFSGSGIIDTKNLTGLKKDAQDTALFFYTCAGDFSEASKGKPFTQNIAFSTDGGETLHKYKTVLNQIAPQNRDPKVIYYQPDDCYIMALFLENHEFALFNSMDLINWQEFQRIKMEKFDTDGENCRLVDSDAECPDFYPLTVEGEPEVEKWIFSAASDRYFIGIFDGKQFTPETDLLRLNYGNSFYAAQSWSHEPKGRRIRTGFVNTVIPGMPFGCCMSLPQQMTLEKIDNQLKLCANPVEEVEKLYSKTDNFQDVEIDSNKFFCYKVDSKACDVTINMNNPQSFSVELFGMKIEYIEESGCLRCKTGKEEREVIIKNPSENNNKTHIAETSKTFSLRIIYDTIYTEIYGEKGSVFMGMTYIQDFMMNKLTFTSPKKLTGTISISQMKK